MIKGASATELCEGLRDAVRLFEDGIEPTDDLTVMALRYLGQIRRNLADDHFHAAVDGAATFSPSAL